MLSDIIEFLEDNSIQFNECELTYLFKKLDIDRDGRISYADFSRAILPKGENRLK